MDIYCLGGMRQKGVENHWPRECWKNKNKNLKKKIEFRNIPGLIDKRVISNESKKKFVTFLGGHYKKKIFHEQMNIGPIQSLTEENNNWSNFYLKIWKYRQTFNIYITMKIQTDN